MSALKFDALLFDCDGVLVDSEAITHSVLCAMLNEAGWALSLHECMGFFLGRTVRSQAALIEAHTGRPLTDAWMAELNCSLLRGHWSGCGGPSTASRGALPAPREQIGRKWKCN